MKTPFRLNPIRAGVAKAAFLWKIRELAPHVRDDAEQIATSMFGDVDVRESRLCPVHEFEKRLQAIAGAAGDLAKRKPIKTTIAVAVEGDFPAQFADIWNAYVKAAGVTWDGPVAVTVKDGSIMLAWETGHYRLNREFLLPGDEYKKFEGTIEIDPELMRKPGAYQVESTADGVRLCSLAGKLTLLRLVWAFRRQDWGRRWARNSIRCLDLIRRVRAGGKFSYSAKEQRWSSGKPKETEVTLTAGKTDAAYIAALKAREAHYLALAARVKAYRAALVGWAEAEAVRFAQSPAMAEANARRELAAAKEKFKTACADWFLVAAQACYRRDLPAEVFKAHPGKFPPAKAVSDGVLQRYRRACAEMDDAWTRLIRAAGALNEKVPVNAPSDERWEQTKIGQTAELAFA